MTRKRKFEAIQPSLQPIEEVEAKQSPPLRTAGLFAGIGGIESGLEKAGHTTQLLVEYWHPAKEVLRQRFPESKLQGDVREVKTLPRGIDLVTAGFPCQDLSSVGQKVGIKGTKSSLVGEVFRLLELRSVPWVILENVPFILKLDGGRALRLVTSALEELGYQWAYRVMDANAFGVPQRRRRWYLVASLHADPRGVILADAEVPRVPADNGSLACGFYWTEGMRALGWAVDAVPPIKVGSTLGVASPPAIMFPDGSFGTPDIRDAERLQGFPVDWTQPAEGVARTSSRWQLVGNAVCVNVSAWLGQKLRAPKHYDGTFDERVRTKEGWPYAAWSAKPGEVFAANVNDWPVSVATPHLHEFLQFPRKPLSPRAAAGFLKRTEKGSLRFPPGFIDRIKVLAAQLNGEAAETEPEVAFETAHEGDPGADLDAGEESAQ